MTTNNPPTFYFNGIDFNDAFYIPSSTGITLSYANSNYLARQGTATSIATSTNFSGSVQIGNTLITQSGNNLILTNGSNIALTLTNALNTSVLSGYSTMAYLNPIPSGIIYLTGTSGFSSGSYNLETDTYGHLNFATGTNTLNIGISAIANGNLNLYNQGVLSIPDATGTAINVPNGNINSNTISTITTATIGTSLQVNSFANIGGNILMNGATSSVLYTNNATNQLRIQGAPATSTYGVIISTNAGGSGDALSVIPTGATTALITLAQPTNITSTLNVGNQMTSNSTIAGNRQILSSYFNMGGTLAGAPAYCGRVYGDIGLMVFECPQVIGISSFIFYAQNNAVPINAFQITATTISTPNPISCSSLTTTANINLNGANSSITNNTAGGTITIATPNAGSNIYLNVNNTAGLTISSTAIVNSLNLTLPATYSAIPSIAQLGGNSQITFTASQAISSTVFKNLGSITTPAGGTYIINLSVSITCTIGGTLTRHVIEASTSNSVFNNNMSQQQQYESIALIATNGQVWTTSYTIQATTATTIYGNVLLAFTGTMTGTGLISYTRIA